MSYIDPTTHELVDGQVVPKKMIVCEVVRGADGPQSWNAHETRHATIEEANAKVNESADFPDFVLGVIRDRKTGTVSRIEPRRGDL